MKTALIILSILFTQTSWALDCQVQIITDQEYVINDLVVPLEGPGHGAPEVEVMGEFNQVTAMADGQWLGLRWEQSGVLVAESLNVLRDVVTQPRTMIVYNPKNTEEQVSISCQ